MRAPPLLIACLALGACRQQDERTPEGAYLAFAAAAGKGDDAAAFARLTTASRSALRARVDGLAAASGGALHDEPAPLVFGGGRAPSITAVRLLRKDEDRATVAVTAGGVTRDVTLLREGTTWRVEVLRGEP